MVFINVLIIFFFESIKTPSKSKTIIFLLFMIVKLDIMNLILYINILRFTLFKKDLIT